MFRRLSRSIRRGVLSVVVAGALLGMGAVPVLALVIHNESINGDFSFANIVSFTLTTGSNEIIGVVGPSPTDVFDPFAFTVPVGQQLDAVFLVDLERPTAITLFEGPSAEVPSDIGGVVAQPTDIGTDLLPRMGLTPPLPAGTYSIRLFAAFEFVQPYHLDLQVSSGAGDIDGDGVPDEEDDCPGTLAGAVVNEHGCSIDQLCSCENRWKNHGQYVSCVSHAAEDFIAADMITEAEKDAIVSEAAQSSCGGM